MRKEVACARETRERERGKRGVVGVFRLIRNKREPGLQCDKPFMAP